MLVMQKLLSAEIRFCSITVEYASAGMGGAPARTTRMPRPPPP